MSFQEQGNPWGTYGPAQPTQPWPPAPPAPVGGARRGNNLWLILGVAGLALFLLVACVGVGAFVFLRRSSGPSATPAQARTSDAVSNNVELATSVAKAYVNAVNTKDATTATKLTCKHADAGGMYDAVKDEKDLEFFVVGVEIRSPGNGLATVALGEPTNTMLLLIEVRNGAWCITA